MLILNPLFSGLVSCFHSSSQLEPIKLGISKRVTQPIQGHVLSADDSKSTAHQHSKRFTGEVHQYVPSRYPPADAPKPLSSINFISQYPDETGVFPAVPIEKLCSFAHRTFGPSNKAIIYVLEDAFDLNHQEFYEEILPGVKRGHYSMLKHDGTVHPITPTSNPPPKKPSKLKEEHGTCVVNKIIGKRFGVSKTANVRMVRAGGRNADNFVPAFRAIIQNIKEERENDPDFFPIINFSIFIPALPQFDKMLSELKVLVKELVDLDTLFVLAAGNEGETHKQVNSYPALWFDEFRDDFLIVGEVDDHGIVTAISQVGDIVEIYGPTYVEWKGTLFANPCAKNGTRDEYIQMAGTSIAVPGLAAQAFNEVMKNPSLRQFGSTAKNVKGELLGNGYPRQKGGVKCIWNGERSNICDFESDAEGC